MSSRGAEASEPPTCAAAAREAAPAGGPPHCAPRGGGSLATESGGGGGGPTRREQPPSPMHEPGGPAAREGDAAAPDTPEAPEEPEGAGGAPATAPQAEGGSGSGSSGGGGSVGTRASVGRERLKRAQKAMKAEGCDAATPPAPPGEDVAAMTEVKVKTEVPDDYIQEVVWQEELKEPKKKGSGVAEVPAEICVVIGGVRNQQTLGKLGSYECGICGKKYKYYNCFQTHVRAHRDTEAASGEGASPGNNFRYTCDICGKKYKYYSCFQEHRDLHAVDDPYDQAVAAKEEVKEEEPEPFQKIGPKTGNYNCEFCGKQYKYYTPYQEHVALHAPISRRHPIQRIP